MESLDYWRLCEELTLVQAACLLAGGDPAAESINKQNLESEKIRLHGYKAALAAIKQALQNGRIKGIIKPRIEQRPVDPDDFTSTDIEIPDSIDAYESFIQVKSLKKWLRFRGITTGFFFPGDNILPDYLDKTHDRYAPKLAAAVQAWIALEDSSLIKKSPKQALIRWLREHSKELELCHSDGKPNESGIEEIAKVANWLRRGGAPKTGTLD
ncbi:MAG: hypothetical protein JKX88_00870 [Marinicaulis sp.]|nr:hypothetical protein [Marinicaulis sp.]